ncbi:AfsR/SARP family transcriptional regulator [Streptomyces resistomycificus]|uniref:Regulator protein n=1 Tax=Streptomyces resistomycificus TaxID=67356 RepID=A0A0L8L3G0_9ACTN|nr:AfsR/SARP family transcriptional regulator [Streptomyces resistomycificus]KOG32640.1 regulator protein [Streptomyces resistomycificus]KUN90584.1 regulator protein [Streptomyces resistomycificus]
MEFRILGPVQVRDGAVEIPLQGAKQRTVLAALLMAEDSYLADTELSWFLWGDHPPATLSAQLYTQVSRLRRRLGAQVAITRRAQGYRLRTGAARLDFGEFQQLAAHGQSALGAGDYRQAGGLLRDALVLWRGPVLANVSEHLLRAEGPALEEARVAVLAGLMEADLALGRHPRLVPALTRLVARHPVHERFRAQLMTALYRCDRRAEALAVYDRGRRLLVGELGIEPGALLRDVHRAVLASDPCLHRPLGQWRAGAGDGPGAGVRH